MKPRDEATAAAPTGAFLHRTREWREAEEEALAPAATRAASSKGRVRPEPPDPYRTAFEQDRDRILHSKAFRRLKHKTQVFVDPREDHTITRLTHTLQVTQIARAIAAALGLNEPLTEAIALGHDVGHSPFGHAGERALAAFLPGGWHHASQSVRIFEVLEDRNLTWEVRDGIRAHSWIVTPGPATPEGATVRYADRIAYLSHDALDAVRHGVLSERDLPAAVLARFGGPGSAWIGEMIESLVAHSHAAGEIGMDAATLAVMQELREFMFSRVYLSEQNEAQQRLAERVVTELMAALLERPETLPPTYRDPVADLLAQVTDFVAGMTDRYALSLHEQLVRG